MLREVVVRIKHALKRVSAKTTLGYRSVYRKELLLPCRVIKRSMQVIRFCTSLACDLDAFEIHETASSVQHTKVLLEFRQAQELLRI